MEAIILAGGYGKRLSSLISDVPKPMALINEKPFLEILLIKLAKSGFKKIILAVSYKYEKIVKHFGNTYQEMNIEYSVEKDPLGTGGAIKLASNQVSNNHFYVFNGDTFLDLDIKKVEYEWTQTKKPIIIGRKVNNVSRYGKIIYKKKLATKLIEKGENGAGVINAGCYVLNKKQLDNFVEGEKFSFENDYLVKAIKNKIFNLYVTSKTFIDIGIPSDFIKAQTVLRNFIN